MKNNDTRDTELYDNYPGWIIILENTLALIIYIIGTLILSKFSMIIGMGYFIYCLISVVVIWILVCPSCSYYGKFCPCGYGKIAPIFSKKKDEKKFAKQFKYLVIFSVFSFFLPVAGGLFLLIKQFSLIIRICSNPQWVV